MRRLRLNGSGWGHRSLAEKHDGCCDGPARQVCRAGNGDCNDTSPYALAAAGNFAVVIVTGNVVSENDFWLETRRRLAGSFEYPGFFAVIRELAMYSFCDQI